MWDCLVVTCPPDGRALALQKETELLRSRGWLDPDLPVLTAEDPAPAAGSGTATLNALLVAAEFLSLRRGYSVVTADVFGRSRVLVLHHGRTYLWECRGKAFVDLSRTPPEEEESGRVHAPDNCLRRLLRLVEKVSRDEESGVWVCSTDALLLSSSPGPSPSGSSSASPDAEFLTGLLNFCRGFFLSVLSIKDFWVLLFDGSGSGQPTETNSSFAVRRRV
ncbi:L-fucose kinase-like [Centruroides vittatus]|uniref:L-fucose kinase-like n=1 Tax=Centruroides vittatus TaxID=120091 RepID=UPI00350ED162